MSLFELLSDEANSRFVGTVTAIIQTVGLVLPALVAAFTYVNRSQKKARDEVIKFFLDWNSIENRQARQEGALLLNNAADPAALFEDHDRRQSFQAFLNDYEMLAIFVLSEGKSSWRLKIARDYFKADVVSAWMRAQPFVNFLRHKYRSDRLFSELERLTGEWSN